MTTYGLSKYYADILAPAIIMILMFGAFSLAKNSLYYVFRRKRIVDIKKIKK